MKTKDILISIAGLIFIILFFAFVGYVLPKIESFYAWIGDNIPFLEGFIDWAENLIL